MEAVKFAKVEDRVERSDAAGNGNSLHLDALSGVWLNTNKAGQGIIKVVVTQHGSRIVLRVYGAGDSGPFDWGEVEAEHIYAGNIGSHTAAGLTTSYHFDFSDVQLQANWNQGLLVLASFTSFKDGSDRSNYFSREFFHSAAS